MRFTFAWGFVFWAVFVHGWAWGFSKALSRMDRQMHGHELPLRYTALAAGFSIGAITFYPVDTVGGVVFSVLAGFDAWLGRQYYRRVRQNQRERSIE